MKSSNTNARTADSGSTEFPWKWSLSDLDKRPKHGHTVFSCFSCGGGSSMGYKLAGFDVVGNCEIDPDMMKVYKQNNHPKHSFCIGFIGGFSQHGTINNDYRIGGNDQFVGLQQRKIGCCFLHSDKFGDFLCWNICWVVFRNVWQYFYFEIQIQSRQ